MTGVIGGIVGAILTAIVGAVFGLFMYAEGERRIQEAEEYYPESFDKP
jgi:hypothetical protein